VVALANFSAVRSWRIRSRFRFPLLCYFYECILYKNCLVLKLYFRP